MIPLPSLLVNQRLLIGLVAAGAVAAAAASLAHEVTAQSARSLSSPPSQDLLALPTAGFLVPFVVEIPGGLANSAAVGSANPEILIDSDGGEGHFTVTSILVKSNLPTAGFRFLSVNTLELNGTEFDTRTENLMGEHGSGVIESADLMGMPIRTGGLGTHVYGGTFPTEVIAQNLGVDDVRIQLFARSDVSDLDIDTIRVAGYKRRGDAITVTYVPGN